MSELIRDFNDGRDKTIYGPEVDGSLAIFMADDGAMSLDRYSGPGYLEAQWDNSYFTNNAIEGVASSKGTAFLVSNGDTTKFYSFGNYWWPGVPNFTDYAGFTETTDDDITYITDLDGIYSDSASGTLVAEISLPDFDGVIFRQIITYDSNNRFYTIDFEFENNSGAPIEVDLAHGGDTELYRSDRAESYAILEDGAIIVDEADVVGRVIGVGARKMDPAIAPDNSTETPVDGVSTEVRLFMFSLDEALAGYNAGSYVNPYLDWFDNGNLDGSAGGSEDWNDGWLVPEMRDSGYGLEWEFSVAGGVSRAVKLTEAFVLGSPAELGAIFDSALASASPPDEDTDGVAAIGDVTPTQQADEGAEVQRSTEGAGANVTYAGDPLKELQYQGGAANETVSGGSFRDNIQSGGGSDNVFGEGGDDLLEAGEGNDVVDGGVGDDVINGGAGDDVVFGGEGADRLSGGAGADLFAFAQASSSLSFETSDAILDFTTEDRIILVSDAQNVSFGSGSVSASSLDALFALGREQAAARMTEGQAGIFVFTSAGVPGQSVVFYDTDGDGVLDGGITITGSAPVAGSFGLLAAA